MTDVFGELRSLLQAKPDAQTLARLGVLMRGWGARGREEVLLPYAEAAVARWPDALRAVGPEWAKRLLSGEERWAHATRFARALTVSFERPTRAEWEALAWCDWGALRRFIAMEVDELDAGIEALSEVGVIERLHELHVSTRGGAPSVFEAMGRGELADVRALMLEVGELGEDDLLRVATSEWRQLRALALNGGPIVYGAAGAYCAPDVLAEEDFAPRLTTLHLSGACHGHRTLEMLARAPWTPRLEELEVNGWPTRDEDRELHAMAMSEFAREVNLSALRVLRLRVSPRAEELRELASNPTLGRLERIEVLWRGRLINRLPRLGRQVLDEGLFSEAVRAQWRGEEERMARRDA